MKSIVLTLTILLLFLSFDISVSAQNWYFPMTRYEKRIKVKNFADLINDNFYKDKERFFPYNRFYGYHAAVDLEYLPEEKNKKVPVYAVTTGKIKYIGNLEGYGGVMLQDIGGEKSALYGHVKIDYLKYKVGQEIKAGEIITYLGDEFSSDTSLERKHLHFGIYKGDNLYFRGHEKSLHELVTKWEDPTQYLKKRSAIQPGNDIMTERSVEAKLEVTKDNESPLRKLIDWLKGALRF